MQVLVFLILAFVAVSAQEEAVDGEKIIMPCCTKSQTIKALTNLYMWIINNYNCDPLFQCIFKCLGVSILPSGCSPNTSLHISFNMWLLNNYQCLPNPLLQCLKGCPIYTPWPPCPIISPVDPALSQA